MRPSASGVPPRRRCHGWASLVSARRDDRRLRIDAARADSAANARGETFAGLSVAMPQPPELFSPAPPLFAASPTLASGGPPELDPLLMDAPELPREELLATPEELPELAEPLPEEPPEPLLEALPELPPDDVPELLPDEPPELPDDPASEPASDDDPSDDAPSDAPPSLGPSPSKALPST